MPDSTPHDSYAALRFPDFRRYITMRFVMILAGAIQSVCTMWWIYELTNSPFMLGLTGLFEAVPAILLSLYAGHLADKYNRRGIVLACLVFTLINWVFLASLPFLADSLPKNGLIGCIYAVSFFVGVQRAFFSPAAFSFLGQLVPKENLGNAITWNSTSWEVANLGGLSLGGLIYGWLGIQNVYFLVVLLAGIGLFTFSLTQSRPMPEQLSNEPALVRIRQRCRARGRSRSGPA